MIIAVNTCFSTNTAPVGYEQFVADCITGLAASFPGHRFVFIADRAFNNEYFTSQNITGMVIGPPVKNPLLRQYWYNYRLPVMLKKIGADILLNMGGTCSLRTKIPQCLVVKETDIFNCNRLIAKNELRFFNRSFPRFLNKAKRIVVFSEFSKSAIGEKYKREEEKIDLVYPFASKLFKPAEEAVKDAIKEKYSEGKEYFLYYGAIHPQKNLLNLLKAFSFFKKRQKSNMQLLIAGQADNKYPVFSDGLKTFKFRDEVKLLGFLQQEELTRVVASAYAFVYPSLYEEFALPPVEAMQSGVAVITSNTGALPEICAGAALFADPSDFNDIADKMMVVFKDENKKKELLDKGKARAGDFNLNNATSLIWQSILKCTEG